MKFYEPENKSDWSFSVIWLFILLPIFWMLDHMFMQPVFKEGSNIPSGRPLGSVSSNS